MRCCIPMEANFNASSTIAETEKLIATDEIPDTTPAKPIVSVEVVAEALPTKKDVTKLEIPS